MNQQVLITTIQTVWLREHNRVANYLRRLYPGDNITDDFLYHEARRIVIAELQHITYTEYLPTIIGNTNNWLKNNITIQMSFDFKCQIQEENWQTK